MKLNTKYILKKHLHRTMEKEKSTVLNVAAAGGGGGSGTPVVPVALGSSMWSRSTVLNGPRCSFVT